MIRILWGTRLGVIPLISFALLGLILQARFGDSMVNDRTFLMWKP